MFRLDSRGHKESKETRHELYVKYFTQLSGTDIPLVYYETLTIH
jgi:hypothetical protein